MTKKIAFNIDIVSSCNLACPSCPVGNSQTIKKSTGLMKTDLLRAILEKASSECLIQYVGLFNWTEPLIHPQLPEFVEIVQQYTNCYLSSNLNLEKVDFEKLLSKNPYHFRISLSGYNQIIYGQTHKKGNIDKVKENMRLLSEAKKITGSCTEIQVLYHRYLGNLDDELLMKKYTENLGFSFLPVWAFMMPLEKLIECIDSPENLSPQDIEIIKKLALPPSDQVIKAAKRYKNTPCVLRDNQITLNNKGEVLLCCAVFDQNKYTLTDYLSTSLTEIQKIKYNHHLCSKCMDNGLHVLATYGAPAFNKIATKNITQHYQKETGLNLDRIMGVRMDFDRFSDRVQKKLKSLKARFK